MHNYKLLSCAPTFLLLSLAAPAFANERAFTYTYQSPVAGPGEAELETWVTYRAGREHYYQRYDTRVEFEGGVMSRLQSALYLNFSAWAQDTPDELTGERYRSSATVFQGISNEWKLSLLDPTADPVGLALYAEGTFGPELTELESKVILDKDFGAITTAVNAVGEYEWEHRGPGVRYTYALFEADLGVSMKLNQTLSLGGELSVPFRFYQTAPPGASSNAVVYLGPTLAARLGKFWVSTSAVVQIAAPYGASSGVLNLEDHERFQVRSIWGFHL